MLEIADYLLPEGRRFGGEDTGSLIPADKKGRPYGLPVRKAARTAGRRVFYDAWL